MKNFMSNIITLVTIIFLTGLVACGLDSVAPTTAPTLSPTTLPVATLPTIGPAATDGLLHLSLDTGILATSFESETVAAVPASDAVPYWEVLPQYTRVTLQGYPISAHLMKPQIFIYPVEDLQTVNEGADSIIASLQTLLQSPQEMANMPFLPMFNAAQVTHTQVQYLNFKNGQGLRYLTEFAQGILPINNHELIYTYQGITNDGKYYVAVILPVNHPSLPADGKVTGNEPSEFTSDFRLYVANLTGLLDSQAANTFVPDLAQLDSLTSSMEIK